MNSREVEDNIIRYSTWAYVTAVINDNQEKQYTIPEVKKMSRDQQDKLLNCKTKKKMTGHKSPEEHQNSQEK